MNPNAPMTPGGLPPVAPQASFQPQSASQMKANKPLGFIIAIVILSLLFVSALGFGIWAFMERGTYKDKTDQIVAKEVKLAETRVATEKDKLFIEEEKKPNKPYQGPSTFGSVEFSYPKTWSSHIDEKGDGNTPIDGYLHPNFVPGLKSGTAFALRIQVTTESYDAFLKSLDSRVRAGKITVTPYRAELVPDVLGARVEGEINTGQKDIMVVFPIRDKTLKVSTESETFYKDFNETILKTLKFVP